MGEAAVVQVGQVIQDDVSRKGMRRVHLLCGSQEEAVRALDYWLDRALGEGGNKLWLCRWEEREIGMWHVSVGWKP
jgi:hypothetical protein